MGEPVATPQEETGRPSPGSRWPRDWAPLAGQARTDLLAEAARLAWKIAGTTCVATGVQSEAPRHDSLSASEPIATRQTVGPPPTCASYHGLYPLLRALGLAATPERHATFYQTSLRPLAHDRSHARVLISGSADAGMLEQVVRAYRAAGAPLDPIVLDLCPTPSALCRAFAKRVGLRLETTAADLLAWQPGRTFDLVTTHSLIAKFRPEQRRELFACWRALLRVGGRLVTTTRIDPDEQAPGFDPERAEALADTLCAALRPEAARLGIDPEAARPVAIAHGMEVQSHAVPSVEALRADLAAEGFAIERLDSVVHRGRVTGRGAGAGIHRTARYADFVARAR